MSSQAPWASLFFTHIAHIKPPTFTLSTLHHSPGRTPPYTPRARTCIYRGMLGSPPRGPPNTPSNPLTLASDLLTFTTDARSAKVPDLLGPSAAEDVAASGGGGMVEAVFWIEGVKTQWRIRGDTWVIGPDIEGGGLGAEAAKAALQGRLRGSDEGWSWERERIAHFWGLGPELRMRFAGEVPGMVMQGEGREGIADEGEAKNNFRLVVLRPEQVECVDLTDEMNAKRWIYTFVGKEGEDGEWKREDLNP